MMKSGSLPKKFNEMRRNLKTAVDKLRQEERKLTTIVENLGEGLIVVEPGGRVLYVNRVAEQLLNLGRTGGYQNFITIDAKTGTISWTKRLVGDVSTTADTRTVDLKSPVCLATGNGTAPKR